VKISPIVRHQSLKQNNRYAKGDKRYRHEQELAHIQASAPKELRLFVRQESKLRVGPDNAFTAICPIISVNNSHRLGLALFALAVIIFFGQRYVLAFVSITVPLLMPQGSGFYEVLSQSYYVIYIVSVILIIAGIVMFFKGRKETSLTSAPAER
jgi:hypothetical protein